MAVRSGRVPERVPIFGSQAREQGVQRAEHFPPESMRTEPGNDPEDRTQRARNVGGPIVHAEMETVIGESRLVLGP